MKAKRLTENQELAELLALRSEMLAADPPEEVAVVDGQIMSVLRSLIRRGLVNVVALEGGTAALDEAEGPK